MAGVSSLIPLLPIYSHNLGELWANFVVKFELICKLYGPKDDRMAAMLPLALRDKALANYSIIKNKYKAERKADDKGAEKTWKDKLRLSW